MNIAERIRTAVTNACLGLVGAIVGRPAAVAAKTTPAPFNGATPLRLNLGCGDKLLPGYVNIDVAPARRGARPDVICDLRRLEGFADACADEVLAVHVVEHFWRWEVEDLLRE